MRDRGREKVKRGVGGNPSGLRVDGPGPGVGTASLWGKRGPGWEVIEPLKGRKNRWLAAFLSLVWPGLGQMYAGRWGKGLLMFFGQMANLVLLFATVGLFSVPALWLWGVIDAYAGAARAPAAVPRRPVMAGGTSGTAYATMDLKTGSPLPRG